MTQDFAAQLDAMLAAATGQEEAPVAQETVSVQETAQESSVQEIDQSWAVPAQEEPVSGVPESGPVSELIAQDIIANAPTLETAIVQVETPVSVEPISSVQEPISVQTSVVETPEQKARRIELSHPIVGIISTEKMVHGNMILNGICTHCVRCRLALTDSVSVERGMGPECSAKGYAEDPKDPDEMGAMIELSAYPALVDFLTEHYKPHGVRGLMNGLVRIAALNRKSPVHSTCANAIELLGYTKLAAALRDSLAIMWIKDSELHPGCYHVRVRTREWTRAWTDDCYKTVPHCFYDKAEKGLIVPKRLECKTALWRAMTRHYPEECVKTPRGTVRIPTNEVWEAEWRAKRAVNQ